LEERGILTVVEFQGRRIFAIQVYHQANEYHQILMANELARRQLRRDGSDKKLEVLLRALPPVLST
jgi:hypothetical protein